MSVAAQSLCDIKVAKFAKLLSGDNYEEFWSDVTEQHEGM